MGLPNPDWHYPWHFVLPKRLKVLPKKVYAFFLFFSLA
jgi:hypothetical protein